MAEPGKRPIDQLRAGAEVVARVLAPHGFRFRIDTADSRASGGPAAAGSFRAGGKRLELHFRSSLGLVTYHVGSHSLSHEDYMRCLGVRHEARYPGFSDDPLQAFADLASDLDRFCRDFVRGDGAEVARCALALQADPDRFRGLP